MAPKAIRALPIVTLSAFVLASARPLESGHQASFKLQIESLNVNPFSLNPLRVHVTATSPGPRRAPIVALDKLVEMLREDPPATLSIADSVTNVHVVVDGFASVRATLTSAAGDSVVSEGRDITLSRTPGGRFARIWTVQPLLP